MPLIDLVKFVWNKIMSKELSNYTIIELSKLLKDKKFDPLELLMYFNDKIKKHKDQSIFISKNDEISCSDAIESTKRYRDDKHFGPLDGIPLAWKDLFDIKGYRTTCGSLIRRNENIIEKDANVVSNCKEIGMVVIGKVNMTEFAFSGVGINPNYGTPNNSFSQEKKFIPGGSSSGSAVSVASGLCPASIGTDTGGSVRIPASMNGLIGYKSSEMRIDKSSVHPLSHTLDSIGPIGKCIDDCILIERALRNEHIVLPRAADLSGISFVVPKNYVFDNSSDEVIENFENCLSILSQNGLKIKREYIKEFDEMVESSKKYGTIVTAEAFYNLNFYLNHQNKDLIDNRVIDRIELGREQSAMDYINIVETRRNLNLKIKKIFDDKHFLLMPTVAIRTPEIKDLLSSVDEFHRLNSLILRNTMIGNYFNLPGVTFPSGFDMNGIPTGILLSSYSNSDEELLCYSRNLEKLFTKNFKL
ncbi:MAG: Glutamyl-tRNA(Gln) amidotransferase subunit A [Alphaproteobacteria bacterium MarineAlpha2_Bin1]|nr:MAG: Glutamyl-tRNA(Gln) amidotransferase subunit A [Alphaproteobacteria bacterium MarineAlpha2_Bin1]